MKRGTIKIMESIKKLLEKEGELSIYQISKKVGAERAIVTNSLEGMKSLGIVKERSETKTQRKSRLFSLK